MCSYSNAFLVPHPGPLIYWCAQGSAFFYFFFYYEDFKTYKNVEKNCIKNISLAATLIQQLLTFCHIFLFLSFYECVYVYSLCVFRLLNHLKVNTDIMALLSWYSSMHLLRMRIFSYIIRIMISLLPLRKLTLFPKYHLAICIFTDTF